MFEIRRLALLTLVAVTLTYAGILWWADETIDRYNDASADLRALENQTAIHAAPTLSSETTSVAADQDGNIAISRLDLQLATILLILITFGATTVMIWQRPRQVGKPSTAAEDRDAAKTLTEQLLATVSEQQQQLDAMQVAITSLTTQGVEPGTGDSAGDASTSHSRARLLAHLSHELRTPLHGILGNAQIMRRGNQINPSSLPALETIERCGRQLLGFVNDMIDFARLEDGKLTLSHQPCPLQRIVEEAATALQADAEQKGVTLQIDTMPKPLPWVISDGPRLRQLIKRLTASAITHAAAENSSRGTIKLHLRLADGSLSVSLKGRALRPQQPANQTELASQPAANQADDDDLAYAIGSRLVALFGGEMLSDVATGDFSARIPCEKAPDQPAIVHRDTLPRAAAGGMPSPSLKAHQQCRVMIVDAEASECTRVAKLLTGAQCTVEEQASVAQASRRLQDEVYDLVLLAIDKPDLTAQDDASELRLVAAGEPKVVAFSKTSNPQGLRKIGFDAVLNKPIDPSELIATVQDLLPMPISEEPSMRSTTTANAFFPSSQKLGRDTAAQIIAALELGDVDGLLELAKRLSEQPGIDPRLADQLTRLAQRFDFSALRELALQLEGQDTTRHPDA